MSIAPYPICSCGQRIVGLSKGFSGVYALHSPQCCQVGIERYIEVCAQLLNVHEHDARLPTCHCGQIIEGTMKWTDGHQVRDRRLVLHPHSMCSLELERFGELRQEFIRTYKGGIVEAKRDLCRREEDVHFKNAAAVAGILLGEVTWEQRQFAKRCAFGADSEEAARANLEVALQLGKLL